MGKLTLKQVEHAKGKATGKKAYSDGDGLQLIVRESGSKSWNYRFQLKGKRQDMGLGGYPDVGLKEARELAAQQRALVFRGVNPVEARNAEKNLEDQAILDASQRKTVKECSYEYIDSVKSKWKNAKHQWQWENTLERFVFPLIGNKYVSDVDTADVRSVLSPIWESKTETATRVRSRLENILDAAKVLGYREGENPARWKGHLDKILPAKPKASRVKNFAALPFWEVPEFMVELSKNRNMSARALEFTVHTALRTSEALNLTWDEVDFDRKRINIPSYRMKSKAAHEVPMTEPVIAILQKQIGLHDILVFPGTKVDRPLCSLAMLALLRRKGAKHTVHGFRSTFTDYLHEMHDVSREVVEMALSHTIGDEVERAYRRGNLYHKRVEAMKIWSDHLQSEMTQSTDLCNTA